MLIETAHQGIGHNRLELGEESTIFKQSVSLFSAKLDPLPRRRAQSIGPGTAAPDLEASTSAEWRPTPSGSAPAADEEAAEASGSGLARVAQVAARALAPAKKARPSMQRIGSAGTGASAPATAGSVFLRTASLPPTEPPPSYDNDEALTPSPASPSVTTSSPLEHTATPLPTQSVSQAGPDGRSILHSPGRQERGAERATPNASQAVRFGAAAGALNAAAEGTALSPLATTSAAPLANGISPVNSRRQSMDAGASSLAASSSGTVNAKAKAKKSGIKGLLGGLLKEGDNAEEKGGEEEGGSSADWREFKKGE